MSSDEELIVYDEGPIKHIRFNRPKKLNAIDLANHLRVIDAVKAADESPDVHVIAFSGEGRSFCSGEDLMAGGREWPEKYLKHQVKLSIGLGPLMLHEICKLLRSASTPTVALMHGHALGGGYDYATSCDFRVATEDCKFGDPRVHRALWAAEGWSYKLTRLVPQGWATRISLMGEIMSGTEAYDIGLVHRVYPTGVDLRESAHDFLMQLATLPPESYAILKRHINDGLDLSYKAVLKHMP